MYYRDYLHEQAVSLDSSILWSDYTAARNKVTSMIRKAKQDHFENVVTEGRNKPSKLWTSLRKVFPGKKQSATIPADFSADELNKYFVNIGHEVSSKHASHNDMPWKGPQSVHEFQFVEISVSSVMNFLTSLPKTSSLDIFGMDSKLLNLGSQNIVVSLTHVNLSNHER